MAFQEDLSVFLADFGVPASLADGVEKQVLSDFPDAEIFGGEQIAGEKVITYAVSDFPDLKNNLAITVGGVAWSIKGAPVKFDDGKFARVGLKSR